jgi:hypothetical protein
MVFTTWRGSREIPFFDLIILLPCTFNEHSLEGDQVPSPVHFLLEGFLLEGAEILLPLKCPTQKLQKNSEQVFLLVSMVKLKFKTLFIFVSVSGKQFLQSALLKGKPSKLELMKFFYQKTANMFLL